MRLQCVAGNSNGQRRETWQASANGEGTDARGREQPYERDPDRGTCMISHCLPIEVQVK